MSRKSAVVVCPGRGTYNASELGYLKTYHADKANLLARFDDQRRSRAQTPIAALDAADRFSLSKHTRGDNASGLIYACSYADFLEIERQSIDVVAVTGNSMGWYTALACAVAVSAENGFQIVNTMGTLMQEAMIGGQMLYPFVDEDWQEVPGKKAALVSLRETIPDLYISILLGGMIVFAGTVDALKAAEARLEPAGRFPMRLANHAAFHTPLQAPVAEKGRALLDAALFDQPRIPLVDGRGHVWMPKASKPAALRDYTLGAQVTETYDFTRAITNALKEFAPDILIILGPGSTLAGATAQCLTQLGWQGITDKGMFEQSRQAPDVCEAVEA
ncbi:MAG: ACP S-malonyltransferase, partial [Pseudomonadota bacterium]